VARLVVLRSRRPELLDCSATSDVGRSKSGGTNDAEAMRSP
jgi:hypothetical protein